MKPVCRFVQLAAALLLTARAAGAHELGTIRTYAEFRRDGTYAIRVFVDREHLPPGFASRPVAPARPLGGWSAALAGERAAWIAASVANASHVAFDEGEVRPQIEWVKPDPAEAEPVLRFTGAIPGGSRTFRWSSDLRLGTYLLTLAPEGEEPQRQWVEGGQASEPFALKARVVPLTRGQVARQYLALGFTHIVPKGADHILFVLGIFLLSTRVKPVLLQVTAFTVAHTITLALTIYGVISLKPSIVEPLIALSIVFVAVENVVTSKLHPWRIAVVFLFGLIHGMGFAGVLARLGLPRAEFPTALFSFNAGVELGQLSVILAAHLLIRLPFRGDARYRSRVVIPASLAIGAVGLYWAVTRVIG